MDTQPDDLLGKYVAYVENGIAQTGIVIKRTKDKKRWVVVEENSYSLQVLEGLRILSEEKLPHWSEHFIADIRSVFELEPELSEPNLVGHYVKSSADMSGPVYYGIVICQTSQDYLVLDEAGKPHRVAKRPIIVDNKKIPPHTRAWITEVRLALELHPDLSSHQPEPVR